ncbi:MAG: protein translocase subunit SecF [Pseudomonadaceae bacterium]|nr:protein translocase subunit SecF [Pseudomonadaceae bacterium]
MSETAATPKPASKPGLRFDFMRWRKSAVVVSTLLLAGSIATLAIQGLNFGLDFTGGTSVEVGFEEPVNPEDVRQTLAAGGIENAVVQVFGSDRDLIIRVPPQVEADDEAPIGGDVDNSALGNEILAELQAAYDGVDMRQNNFVGPVVGGELTESGGLAMLVALGVVMIYIMFRFTGKFAIGAVIALVHDVVIVLGAFSLAQWTFDLPVLAAVLAVIGYSLNDTIVVSDRIRENFRKLRRGTSVEIINRSLNETLARTLVTSATTLMVLLALLFFGGELIRGFAIALTIGVVIGTYSSIYVAANMLLALNITREDLMLPEKENSDLPEMP